MPDWLREAVPSANDTSIGVLALRLVLALALGGLVAGIYRVTTPGRENGSITSFLTTLIMLSVLIAMVTQVIGTSIARAFSLVGALSIVRFRTVVEDTRDTAFVIFAVVVGMAVGADLLLVALVGLPVVAAAAVAIRPRAPGSPTTLEWFTLTVRVGVGQPAEASLQALLSKLLEESCLLSTGTARQGAAFETTYRVRLRRETNPAQLVSEIHKLDGVQNVELRRG